MTRTIHDEDEDNTVPFEDTTCVHATFYPNGDTKSLLVRFDDGREIWVPYSQVTDSSEVDKKGDQGRLVVTLWFAEKEGLV